MIGIPGWGVVEQYLSCLGRCRRTSLRPSAVKCLHRISVLGPSFLCHCLLRVDRPHRFFVVLGTIISCCGLGLDEGMYVMMCLVCVFVVHFVVLHPYCL